jgi:molecular chaperone GrpE
LEEVKNLVEEEQVNVEQEEQELEPVFVDVDSRIVGEDKHSKTDKHDKGSKLKAKKIVEDMQNKIAELERINKDTQEQFLRKRAEFENFRRRMEKDKEDFIKYSLEKFIKELIPIIDSFNMALHPNNIPEEQQKVFEGFSLIFKQFQDLLGKSGVTEIEALGKVFDPNFHQAISQEKSDTEESGKVIKEYQKGYKLHDRLLRPSMVVVAE